MPSEYHKLWHVLSLSRLFASHLIGSIYNTENISNSSYWSNFQNCFFSGKKGSPNLKAEVQLLSVFLNINFLKETDLQLFPAKVINRTHLFFGKCPCLAACACGRTEPAVKRGLCLQQGITTELVLCAGPFQVQTFSRATENTPPLVLGTELTHS